MSVEDQFEGDERALLTRIHELLDVRMKDKRKRYVHSLGVAETALHLAEVYGVNRFDAAAAGLIHDWDKVLSDDELVTRALHYGIKIAGSPSAATPLCMARLPPMSFRSFSRAVAGGLSGCRPSHRGRLRHDAARYGGLCGRCHRTQPPR